jgi:hypothetical protein
MEYKVFLISFVALAALAAGAGQANPRFTYSADGSQVTDSTTGLVWKRCSLGQVWDDGACKGSASTHTHKEIGAFVKVLYSDWRLPNFKELSSLRDEKEWRIKINKDAFPATPQGAFLTWTPPANGADSCPSYDTSRFDDPDSCAWYVHFNPEGPYIHSTANAPSYVRLVRR